MNYSQPPADILLCQLIISERKNIMNITIEPIPQRIQPIIEHAVMANGKRIGIIKTILDSDAYNYHAVFNEQEIWNVYHGFGKTIDEAMRNAIIAGKDRRQKELIELNELENIIWGDYED